MPRQAPNEAFLRTSFLNSSNAQYIEEMREAFERNPGAVDDEWRRFFESLNAAEQREGLGSDQPDWAPPLETLLHNSGDDRDLVSALTGDNSEVRQHLRREIDRRAQENGFELSPAASLRATQDSIRALMLIRAYRVIGHLAADLDPLGLANPRIHRELLPETYGFTEADLDRPIFIDRVLGMEMATMREIVGILHRTYCQHVGVQFAHITDPAQKSWLQQRIEGPEKEISFTREGRQAILRKLIEAETFEKFCDLKYTGTKRFGVDGSEAMVPALEQIIKRGGHLGVREIVIGMAHRGRLNVLANVMSKPLRAIFNEFKGGSFKPNDVEGSGDVKYHLGASSDRSFDGNQVHLSLTANPSHLEIVDPVVLGKVRAKQDQLGCAPGERTPVLPLLIHGDAAFAGQGVVAECFGLSGLRGHRTGGSIHFVINNQIGFTTSPHYSRSSPYCSDVALMIEAPIFHVNGDNPEAVVHVAKIATEFRQRFQKPVVIDMFCYRRFGHNEADEPMFTHPAMYKKIKTHPTTSSMYSKRLVEEGVVTSSDVDEMRAEIRSRLDEEFAESDNYKPNKADWLDGRWSGIQRSSDEEWTPGDTSVDLEVLKDVGLRMTSIPKDFNAHRVITRLIDRRRNMIESGEGIDWATAEHLAFATLLMEGRPVRLSGQDVERGTFSQRHSVLIDQENDRRYAPLKHLSPEQAQFEVINSMLSEEAVLGFEYGYSLAEPNTLVMWEAQFGDFANGAQVIFDQFLSSGERKWLRMSGLVCLLPHGYEGQGPEHSSARLERFLQLSAEDNWQVANCTTPANYFHILRRQLHRNFRKPLILMTPKSLLRHKRVVSRLEEFATGTGFHRLLHDNAQVGTSEITLKPDNQIKRVVLCSGKVYYDLLDMRDAEGLDDVYLMRVEQLYPFPARSLITELSRFKFAEIVWCQEEPKNMGAWAFMDANIEWVLNHLGYVHRRPRYAGRSASASTATGLLSQHVQEQKALVADALGVEQG